MPAGRPRKTEEGGSGIRIFDKSIDGQSSYPTWYYDRNLERMKEDCAKLETDLEKGRVMRDNIGYHKAEIEKAKDIISRIEKSKPKLSSTQKDKLAEVYKEIGEKIKEALPTRDKSRKGLVDAHKVLSMQKKAFMKVPEEIATDFHVKIDENGNISGDGAGKIWKIAGKLLDEETNTEHLRRD